MTAQTPAFLSACSTKQHSEKCTRQQYVLYEVLASDGWMKLSCHILIKPGINLEQHSVAFFCCVQHLLYAVFALQYMHLFFSVAGVIAF